MTLLEAMISLALSLVVTTAMVVLMGNSMGTASKIIQMTQLTDELRNSMSMMSRDVRRANYSANAVYCYANSDCNVDGSANQVGDITIVSGTCFTFNLDRDQDGDTADDGAGGFRLRTNAGGVGLIEMWVGDQSPDCNANNDANWVAVTDAGFVDITTLTISDADSYTGSIVEDSGTTLNQRTRNVQLVIEGRLVRENTITRRIEDKIKVRNDLITRAT